MNLNKVMMAGRLTRDPETTTLPSGNTVTNLGFVTNRVFKDKDGGKQEEATFVDVKAWGGSGAQISKYLTKGSPIFIEGRLTLETWESSGEKRSKLVVTLENYKFINDGSRKEKEERKDKDDLGF